MLLRTIIEKLQLGPYIKLQAMTIRLNWINRGSCKLRTDI